MQTFLPFSDFRASARVLDPRRLGKQRVEVLQIIRAITRPGYGWRHHPATGMWRGFEEALGAYAAEICTEWSSRGHADTCDRKIRDELAALGITSVRSQVELAAAGALPPWLGDERLHQSHRAALLRKDPDWYGRCFDGVDTGLPTYWPRPPVGDAHRRRGRRHGGTPWHLSVAHRVPPRRVIRLTVRLGRVASPPVLGPGVRLPSGVFGRVGPGVTGGTGGQSPWGVDLQRSPGARPWHQLFRAPHRPAGGEGRPVRAPGDAMVSEHRRRGIVFANPLSGRRHIPPEALQIHFPDHHVEACPPEDLVSRVRIAVEDGAAFVGVAGGDGTIRGGAEPLMGTDVPLIPVPTGTRNHFAHQIGIHDLEAAGRAGQGFLEKVDLGDVNGHFFVNNSAIGVYPEMVERRERYQRRGLPKRVAQVLAAWQMLRRGHAFDVAMDGRPHRSWLVFVGNGHYGSDLFDLAERHSITQHVLDVRLVRADRRLARTRVMAALLLGRLDRSPMVVRHVCSRVDLDAGSRDIAVALDGELQTLRSPLRYRSRPTALQVLVPPHEPHARPPIFGHHRHHE